MDTNVLSQILPVIHDNPPEQATRIFGIEPDPDRFFLLRNHGSNEFNFYMTKQLAAAKIGLKLPENYFPKAFLRYLCSGRWFGNIFAATIAFRV